MTMALENSIVLDIENEVLSGLMMSKDFKNHSGPVRPEYFLEPINRIVFERMIVAHERFGSVSADVLYRLFSDEEQGTIKRQLTISLPQYLARLVGSGVYGPAGLKHSIPALIGQWARISIGREADMLTAAASDPGADPVGLARSAVQVIDTISASLRSGRRAKTVFSIGEAAAIAIDGIEVAMQRGNGLTGVTWASPTWTAPPAACSARK